MTRFKRPRTSAIIIGCVILVLLIVISVLAWKYQTATKDPAKKSQEKALAEAEKVTKQVSVIYQIPTDEAPTVALIEDKSKLGSEEFYKNAQNGDYVLIFSQNKFAIIYRQNENKIINARAASTNDTAPAKPNVGILNASGNAEKLTQSVNKVKELSDQATLGATADAKKTVAKTIVVDVTGQSPALAKTIAEKLGGHVETSVPTGETIPNGAAIVVIVGKE